MANGYGSPGPAAADRLREQQEKLQAERTEKLRRLRDSIVDDDDRPSVIVNVGQKESGWPKLPKQSLTAGIIAALIALAAIAKAVSEALR